MAEDIKLLKADNLRLNEQIKLLIQTEKQLYDTKMKNEVQIKRINELNKFALYSSKNFALIELLNRAMLMFKGVFPYHGCFALMQDEPNGRCYYIPEDISDDSDEMISTFECANFSFACDKIYAGENQSDAKAKLQLSSVEQLLVLAQVNQEDWQEARKAERPYLIIPCVDREKESLVAALVLFQMAGISTSYHEVLPNQEDMPFLVLAQGHIEAAWQNSRLHKNLENSAKMLEERVMERTEQLAVANNRLEQSLTNLQEAQSELVEISRNAGGAQVANGVLHNVGNVLNSLNVAICDAQKGARSFMTDQLRKALDLTSNRGELSLGQFIDQDEKGQKIFPFLAKVSDSLLKQKQQFETELEEIFGMVEHVKQVVSAQQAFAKVGGVQEPCLLDKLLDQALSLHAGSHHGRAEIIKQVEILEPLNLDRHRTLQILVNLITNAHQAMEKLPKEEQKIFVEAKAEDDEFFTISVQDNGIGIADTELTKIFGQGYSTKKSGHGFGLHSAANAATEMGGSLSCVSLGENKGANFVLKLPLKPAT